MSRRVIWIIVSANIMLLAGIAWWARPAASPALAATAQTQEPGQAPADPGPQSPSQPEAREAAAHAPGDASRHSFQWNTEVLPGESVITDCYEGQSGEFVFSKLTPRMTQDKYGETRIAVQADTFTIDIAGGKGSLADAPMTLTMAPGAESNAEYFADGGHYRVFVKASTTPGSPKISLQTHGDFAELPAEAPATAAEEKDQ